MTEEKNTPMNESTETPQPPAAARSPWVRRIITVLGAVLLLAGAAGFYYWFEHRGMDHGALDAAGDVYYCPMHPQYTSNKPGNCPICNMTLVKREGGVTPPATQEATEPAVAGEYYCPMHPQVTSDKPGLCHICNMKLVQRGSDPAKHTSHATPAPGDAPAAAGAVQISAQRQQLIGVRTVSVEPRRMSREIRTVGKVAIDETQTAHVHTKFSGYIEHVFVDYVGRVVKKGEPLFTIYSPELVATQQEYLIALRARKSLADSPYTEISGGSASLVEAARQRLRLWDISEREIEELEREGKVKRELTVYSPVGGVVIERAAYHHGRFVNPEMDLYTIVDLSRVWVLGEVYEYDLPYVRPGMTAEVEIPWAGGARRVRARVDYTYPYMNPETRTAQVRLQLANPDSTLRPEMFVNLRLSVGLGEYLAVPVDAVLDTGAEQFVFVDKGDGYFEPRRVTTGPESEGFVGITAGLRRGERVVTAANFLIDSESRLKGAFASLGAPAAAPGHTGHTPPR